MSIRMRTHVNLPLNVLRCTFDRWAVPRVGWFCSRLVLGSGSRLVLLAGVVAMAVAPSVCAVSPAPLIACIKA